MTGSNVPEAHQVSLAEMYVDELYWLARDVVETCERVFDATTPPPGSSFGFRVDHQLHHDVYRALNSAARLRALLNLPPKSKAMKPAQYKVQQTRRAWLVDLVKDVPLDTVRGQAKVRNTIEHFDEYIDETVIKYAEGQIAHPAALVMDIVFLNESVMKNLLPPYSLHPMRVYFAQERVFDNCGHRISLEDLHRECGALVAHLIAHAAEYLSDGEVTGEPRSAGIFVLDLPDP